MARINELGETKGEEVRRLVLAALPPSERGSRMVHIMKDTNSLTKVRISRIMEERSDGSTSGEPVV